jgi:hypothetical protein
MCPERPTKGPETQIRSHRDSSFCELRPLGPSREIGARKRSKEESEPQMSSRRRVGTSPVPAMMLLLGVTMMAGLQVASTAISKTSTEGGGGRIACRCLGGGGDPRLYGCAPIAKSMVDFEKRTIVEENSPAVQPGRGSGLEESCWLRPGGSPASCTLLALQQEEGGGAGLEGAGGQRALPSMLCSVQAKRHPGEDCVPSRATCCICSAVQLRGMQEPNKEQPVHPD